MTERRSPRRVSGKTAPAAVSSATVAATPSWPNAEAFCAEVAARVEARIEAMVEAMVEAICAQVATYGALEPNGTTDLRAGLMVTARLFLRTLAEQRDLTPAEVTSLQAIAEERAQQGVPLESLQEAVRIANGVGYDHLHAEADALAAVSTETQLDTRVISRHLSLCAQDFQGQLTVAFSAGYRAGTEGMRRTRSKLLYRLLTEEFRDDEDLVDAWRTGGYALDIPCALVLLVALDGASHDLTRRVAHLVEPWADAIVSPLLSDPIPHVAVMVALERWEWQAVLDALRERVQVTGLVAVAKRAERLRDVGWMYQGAQRPLSVVPTLQQRPRVLSVRQLWSPWLASLLRVQERFVGVDEVLGSTLARRRDWARKDLEALQALRDCRGDIRAAAARLGVTVKSIHSHLDAVERRSGLRPDNAVDRATLGLALWLYWSDPESLPPPGDGAWGPR